MVATAVTHRPVGQQVNMHLYLQILNSFWMLSEAESATRQSAVAELLAELSTSEERAPVLVRMLEYART
jgi:hypothetical protein